MILCLVNWECRKRLNKYFINRIALTNFHQFIIYKNIDKKLSQVVRIILVDKRICMNSQFFVQFYPGCKSNIESTQTGLS